MQFAQFFKGMRGSTEPSGPTGRDGKSGAAKASRSRFALLTVQDLLHLPEPEWLIKGVMPAKSLSQLYGPSGVGKTFVSLDLALSIATGTDWLGTHPVVRGPVVYVAAEGAQGIKKRVHAWLGRHGVRPEDAMDFRLIGEAVPLGNVDDVRALVREVGEVFTGRDLALVVLDTQARCTEGLEENSAKEMGLAVSAADQIKGETGATVLLIHHSGYEADHARGSTVVRAALDSQAKLEGAPSCLTLTCEKQKDAGEFESVRIVLVPWGDSLVAAAEDDPSIRLSLAESTLSGRPRQALAVLRAHPGGLAAKEWETLSELPHSTFYEAAKGLVSAHLVRQEGKRYLATPIGSIGFSPLQSRGELAPSGEVQESTTPLRGGPLDSETRDAVRKGRMPRSLLARRRSEGAAL